MLRQEIEGAALGELCFPTGVDLCRRVLKAVDNPDLGFDALARIVVSEPLLSARLIGLANSIALNPYAQPVRDVKQALMRVGIEPVRTLAMTLLVDQFRQIQRHGACRELANQLWERSVHVAALAYVLARKLGAHDPDEAMFAGIVHDLGRFYLLARAAEHPALLEDTALLADLLRELGERSGRLVLAALQLPASVVLAVCDSQQYSGTWPAAGLSDLLFVARSLSLRPDPLTIGQQNDAAASLGLDHGTVLDLIAASGDEIYSIVLALDS